MYLDTKFQIPQLDTESKFYELMYQQMRKCGTALMKLQFSLEFMSVFKVKTEATVHDQIYDTLITTNNATSIYYRLLTI